MELGDACHLTTSIERRSNPRNRLARLVHVRSPETSLAPVDTLGPTSAPISPPAMQSTSSLANFSLDSIYFLIESVAICKHVQLFVSFPNEFDPATIHREYMVEVVRQEYLHRGRFGIAAKLLENTQLRLRDGLLVPENGFWSRWPLLTSIRLNVYT